jgi:hypothetical protein
MRAGQLAATDTAKALQAARRPDAWYRVQALSHVAEHARERNGLPILEEAVREARSCNEAYGAVAVTAWPLKVALARGHVGFAQRELARCLADAAKIEPRESQAFALELLWTACFDADPAVAESVWKRILELCHPDRSWRAGRLYRHIAEKVEARRNGAAAEIVRAMPEGKARARLARRFSDA